MTSLSQLATLWRPHGGRKIAMQRAAKAIGGHTRAAKCGRVHRSATPRSRWQVDRPTMPSQAYLDKRVPGGRSGQPIVSAGRAGP